MKARIRKWMNELIDILRSYTPTETQVYTGVWGGSMGPLLGAFLGWSEEFFFLILLMILDFITGMLAAVINPNSGLSSSRGSRGLVKKGIMLCVIAAFHGCGIIFHIPNLEIVVIYAYIANELISLLENARNAGVDIPAGLDKLLLKSIEEKKKKL